MLQLHKPMRSRRRNAEDAPICHWETGKAERTKMQSRKTYRISCAGVLRPVGERRSPLHPAMDRTADFFRVRKSRLLRRGFCMHTMLSEVGRSCIWGSTE